MEGDKFVTSVAKTVFVDIRLVGVCNQTVVADVTNPISIGICLVQIWDLRAKIACISERVGVPVKLVGIGEQIGDLIPFDPAEFVGALFDRD